jgi:GntR family transcriptional regulator, transcriptional repressor for pyruvate dehydrogenase complex
MEFNKIAREEPLSQKIEMQIRNAIRQNLFLPGDKLPGELELAQKFGVSRTAVREALRILSGRGLVNIQRGSGVYISEIDVASVVDPFYQLLEMKCGQVSQLHLIRVRKFIEPEIARLAAIHCDDSDIDFLTSNYAQMSDRAEKPEEMIDVDIQFHFRLAEATQNPIIPVIMQPIFQLLHKFIQATYKQSHAPDLALENHRKLLNCMKSRDPDAAFQIMKTHMAQAEEHVLQYYKEHDIQITS